METGLNTETLIIAIACLGLGIAIGTLIARASSKRAAQKGGSSEQQRQEQQELAAYRNEIDEHFIKTAGLMKNLSDSYGHLRQHLTDSAGRLSTPEISHQFTASESTSLKIKAAEDTDQANLKAPLDYAPGNGSLRGD